jgi:hypothetical protein
MDPELHQELKIGIGIESRAYANHWRRVVRPGNEVDDAVVDFVPSGKQSFNVCVHGTTESIESGQTIARLVRYTGIQKVQKVHIAFF